MNKAMFSASSHPFSTKNSQHQYYKANKYSSLTVIELGSPVPETSTGSENFMSSLTLDTNLLKRESQKQATHRI